MQTDEHEGRLPRQRPSSAATAGFLGTIWIVGAVVALAVLFWTAIN